MIVTLITAGVCAFIALVLAVRCTQIRRSASIGFGDGGNDMLIARMRAHANFSEYVPLLLILIGVIEFKVGSGPSVAVAGVALILVRIAHAVGMALPVPNAPRVVGTAGTFTLLIALGVWAIVLAL